MQLVINAPMNAAGAYDEVDATLSLAAVEQAAASEKALALFPGLAGKVSNLKLKEGHLAGSATVAVLGDVEWTASVVVKPP